MKQMLALKHNHQTLQVYLYYRLALSGLLVVMFYAGIAQDVLGSKSGSLYRHGSQLYLLFAIVSLFVFPVSALVHSTKRIALLLVTDIIALLALIHASGGIESGIAYLLIITAAMVSIFVHGQLAYAYAAAISIAIIADTVFLHQNSRDLVRHVFTSGILGILIFTTCISLQYLSAKIRKKTEESESQARHIHNLQEIAQNIVTRMQTGVIVVDHDLRIELMNTSAKQMLDLPIDSKVYGLYLADIRELAPLLKEWESVLKTKQSAILSIRPNTEIRINVAHIEMQHTSKNIFYLEDFSAIKQHAQQLKLASLGKLAASIAHEIRNPLGALSHAAQLLTESQSLATADYRLTEIILNNSGRVNDIIENTLSLSRRQAPQPQQFNLNTWLPSFINEYKTHNPASISLNIEAGELLTKFDLTHLRQILTNLIDNGLRASKEHIHENKIEIEAGTINHDDRAFIEIKDFGQGIPHDKLNDIYEPFYTTHDKGSGLGLYICKELVEINHASLHYQRTNDQHTCFRIDFSHHQRMR